MSFFMLRLSVGALRHRRAVAAAGAGAL